jgi:hypothetical protein
MSDFFEIEAELKKLKPADVSPELETRIERTLAEEPVSSTATAGVLPRRRRLRIHWLPLGLGLAAAAALLLLARTNTETAPRKPTFAAITPSPSVSTAVLPNEYVPSGATRVVYDKRDEGLVFPGTSATPSRRLRYRTRETMQWQNPGTGASLRVSYPSEEVVLVPVSGQ